MRALVEGPRMKIGATVLIAYDLEAFLNRSSRQIYLKL